MEDINLYKKIDELQKKIPEFKDDLSEDQKKILNSALKEIEKVLAKDRKYLRYKIKSNPSNDTFKREVDIISYSVLNISHIRTKLGINSK